MKKDFPLCIVILALCVLSVSACSSSNSSGGGSGGGGIDTTSPSVPQALVAVAANPNQINLTWAASTDNVGVTDYRIYRAGALIATISGTAYYNDTGLSPSTLYAYTVCARDAANNISAQSNVASAATPVLPPPPDTQAPTTPSGLMATPVSSSQINLTWNASTDNVGVTGYNVYRGGTRLASVTAPALNDTGLSASTQYCYTVSAYDGSNNESGQSTFACATTPALPDTQSPTVPTGLAASAVAPGQINLTWNPSTDNVGVTGYNVYRGGTRLASVTAPALNDTGLSASTQYCYTVSAYDGAGNNSGQSASVCATTPALPDTQAPTVPSGLVVDAIGPSQIDLTWNLSTDNVGVIGYKIYRGGAYFMTVAGTSAQNTGLSPNTQYCYSISAIDAAGNESGQTSSVCDTTESSDTELPIVPTGLAANAVSPNQINLTWNASTDNVGVVGYKIYRDSMYFTTVTATSTQNTELAPLTPYCYAISAIDAANNESALTGQQCATTPSTYSMLTGQWWVIMHPTTGSDLYVDATLTQFGASPAFYMQGSGHNYADLSNRDFYYPVSLDSTNSTFNSGTMAVNFMAYTDARSGHLCGIYVVNAAGTVTADYSNISGGAWSEADGTSCANSGPSWTAKRVPDMSGTWWANLTFGAATYSYDIRINQIGATMTVSSIVNHGTSSSVSFTTGSGLHDPVTGVATLAIEGLPCPDNNAIQGALNITGNINAAATAYTVSSVEFQGCAAGTLSGSGTMTRQ